MSGYNVENASRRRQPEVSLRSGRQLEPSRCRVVFRTHY